MTEAALNDALSKSAIRRLVDEAQKSVTPQYRSRIRDYGPDAARVLLELFETLEKEVED